MKIKSDVKFLDGKIAMMHATILAEQALAIVAPEVEFVITSGVDGNHYMHSLHYTGLAYDYRTRDLTPGQQKMWTALIEERLGPDFDVVLEEDHLHVEYDPKSGITAFERPRNEKQGNEIRKP